MRVYFPDNSYCICFVTVDTDCTKEQRDYDEAWKDGTLGFTEVRTLCDEEGEYLSPHCIDGSM
jgi:hypothetical protein